MAGDSTPAKHKGLTRAELHQSWFRRTGHCGACGQPGDYCTCLSQCGCAELHPVGAARADDALAAFREDTAPVVEQDDLFGGTT